ncbi:MAG: NlpC/P60 family protein [Acidimicrobiales bacterium]
MTPLQVAGVAWKAGFRGHDLTTAVAVAMAESNGDPRCEGDIGLEDATWGPSVGLWQIRSYNSDLGRGGTRDARANLNPLTNARHAYQVSNHGTDWGPWSTFTNGAYLAFMGVASAAARTVSADPSGSTHHSGTHHPPVGGEGRPTPGSGRRPGSTAGSGGAPVSPVGAGTHNGGSARVVITPAELAALSKFLEEGDTDLGRGRTQVEGTLDELHRVAADPLMGPRATAVLPLATELLAVMDRLAQGLRADDALVRSTRTKALRSQSGHLHGGGSAPLLGLLGRAGMPPPVVGLLGKGTAGHLRRTHAPGQDGHVPTAPTGRGRSPVAGAERKVVRAAEQYLGVPYVYGGDSRHGVDCSGLTSSAYRNAFEMNIGRDTTAQLASGRVVGHDQNWPLDRRLLQPGDLIFYGQPGAGGPNAHVVMYIGGGRVVQAPYPGQNVQISPLFSSASADEPFLGVRRYLGRR